eukprot:TRINITY_DN29307_c0_g1_i1.p1 TRINITY_DN29307_c0_g1~~TRINITY_DN29307_c0_g1_i1.p1  ORF type:complete len:182 (+),score=43.42 TRINITY_DN29307_c0_g1_i1:123-668(+)
MSNPLIGAVLGGGDDGAGNRDPFIEAEHEKLARFDAIAKPIAPAAAQWAQYAYEQMAYASAARAASAEANRVARMAAFNARYERRAAEAELEDVHDASRDGVAALGGYALSRSTPKWGGPKFRCVGSICTEGLDVSSPALTAALALAADASRLYRHRGARRGRRARAAATADFHAFLAVER